MSLQIHIPSAATNAPNVYWCILTTRNIIVKTDINFIITLVLTNGFHDKEFTSNQTFKTFMVIRQNSVRMPLGRSVS